jgi:hypothetical protein
LKLCRKFPTIAGIMVFTGVAELLLCIVIVTHEQQKWKDCWQWSNCVDHLSAKKYLMLLSLNYVWLVMSLYCLVILKFKTYILILKTAFEWMHQYTT